MATRDFYEEQKEQSRVKTEIVRKYFWAWAQVMLPQVRKHGDKLAYVDLFCGPGRYDDGSESTPLHILRTAIREPEMHQRLVTWFNDKNPEFVESLKREIAALPGIEVLSGTRTFTHLEVGADIVRRLSKSKMPTLVFVDPWGYKGLSLELLNSAIANWGCDCIFFFNYSRINMALNNNVIKANMESLFGMERAAALAQRLARMSVGERELTIIEAISQALQEPGERFVLPFRFRPTSRTSHHLIFVSKNVLGYSIMKDIMAKESSGAPDGMATFEYNPATAAQPLLFALSATYDDLGTMLLDEFAGRTLTMRQIYEEHNIGRPFIESNYKQILAALEADGKIVADPPAVATGGKKARRKGTFADTVKVTFPTRERT